MPDDLPPQINPAYLIVQLQKATGRGDHGRATRWFEALAGFLDGNLRPGTRMPIVDAPVWVTPEVEHGGFVTGRLAAGGELRPHEFALVESLGLGALGHARMRLNLHFLEDAGRPELEQQLADGRFAIQVPEEGAFLVVAWLLRQGEGARAAALVETLAPFFDRLRFYPVPATAPARFGHDVARATAGEVVRALQGVQPHPGVVSMREATAVWTPLYDRLVALFLETVEGEVPGLAREADGSLKRAANGQPVVLGGWPLRHIPDGWRERAEGLLADESAARAAHPLHRRQARGRENHARLHRSLETWVRDPAALSGRDVGMLRRVLASFVSKHGPPGSARRASTRAMQERLAARPLHAELAQVVAQALSQEDPDEGVPGLDAALGALAEELVGGRNVDALPPSIVAKALRCLEAPVGRLVELGVLGSAESLALVIPGLTAAVRARSIADPELRRVWSALYLAFRKRRSLLLLDLSKQVQFSELPWVAAIEPWVGSDEASRTASARVLREIASLSLSAFPQTMIPNRLVRELDALAAGAGISLPLVEELAADIFMGQFSAKFVDAARIAARLLQGSLYERYYGLDYGRLLAQEGAPGDGATREREVVDLAALCAQRVGEVGSGVSVNRAIIEQAQVLTTHNLATLFDALLLEGTLDLPALSRDAFSWIAAALRPDRAAVRRAGHAWRQLVFFLALQAPEQVEAFIDWSEGVLARTHGPLARHLALATTGLREVARGASFDPTGLHPASGGRRFLASPTGRHWMLEPIT